MFFLFLFLQDYTSWASAELRRRLLSLTAEAPLDGQVALELIGTSGEFAKGQSAADVSLGLPLKLSVIEVNILLTYGKNGVATYGKKGLFGFLLF